MAQPEYNTQGGYFFAIQSLKLVSKYGAELPSSQSKKG